MAQLLSEQFNQQANELKHGFFSSTLPQSAEQWQQLATTGILDGFPVGVALFDEHLILTYQNKPYAQYLENYSAGTSRFAAGRCFFDFLPGSRDWTEPSFRYIKDARATLIEHEHEIRLHDGARETQTFWNSNMAAMIHPDKTLAGVVLVCQDASFEKQIMDHLVKLENRILELTGQLEDAKKAIRFLSDLRIEDQRRIQNDLSDSMNSVVLPLLELVNKNLLKPEMRNALDTACTTLADLAEQWSGVCATPALTFTPKEKTILKMIKAGRTTKEMAEILCVSSAAVSFHRANIRRKQGRPITRRARGPAVDE